MLQDTSGSETTVGSLECTDDLAPRFEIARGSDCSAGTDAKGEAVSPSDLAHVRIGWQVSPEDFLTQIEVCHDERTDDTLWTRNVLVGAATALRDTGGDRPPFRRDLKGSSSKNDRFFTELSSDTDVDRCDEEEEEEKRCNVCT